MSRGTVRRAMAAAIFSALWLCWPLHAMGDTDVPVRDLLEAGRYKDAADAVRTQLGTGAAVAQPEQGRLWYLLGEADSAIGSYETALGAYSKAAAIDSEWRILAQVASARLQRRLGDSDGATARLESVLADYRSSTGGLSAPQLVAVGDAALALAPLDASLYATALDIYEEAVQRSPEDPAPRVALGDLLLDRYNNTEALDAYREALEIEPDYPPALLGLARSQHFDHSRSAIDAARRALEVAPHSVAARVLAARLLLELEDYSQAQQEVAEALRINPRSPEALTIAAALHFLRGAGNRSAALVEQIDQIAPGEHEAYVTLAEIAAQNRRYRDAVMYAVRALGRQPSAWRAHALLGMNRMRLGAVDQGRRSLEVAFRGDPFDVRTKNTLDLLDRMDQYETVESERFILVADRREMSILAPMLLPIAERAYDTLAERYRYQPATPIRIEVYSRHEDFSVRTVGLVGLDLLGVSFGPVVVLDSPSARPPGAFNLGSVLWHELAHTFHLDMTRSRVPRWFTEGLSVHEEHRAQPGWGADVSLGFLTAFQQGRLPVASALNDAFVRPSFPEQMLYGYTQGALLMDWIEQSYGFEAIARLLSGYRWGRTTEQLLPEVLGLSSERLDQTFDAYLRSRYAPILSTLGSDEDSAAVQSGQYAQLMVEGREAVEADDTPLAEARLRHAQDLFPEHTGPDSSYRLLATLYTRQQAFDRAIEQLELAVAIDADDLDAHLDLAALYEKTGQADRARAMLERALLIQPFDRALYETLAELRSAAGDWRGAAQAWGAVGDLDPADPLGTRYRHAEALFRAGDTPDARRQVLAALEQAPLYPEALELLLQIRDRMDVEASTDAPTSGDPATDAIQHDSVRGETQ